MDGPERIGKEEMEEIVQSYRESLIELVNIETISLQMYWLKRK